MQKEQINYADAISVANNLKTYADNIRLILEDINRTMGNINTSEVWKTKRSEELSVEFNQLKASKFDVLYSEILDMPNKINEAIEKYKSAE